ncbi:PTS sugar transporter subunit IIA [Caproiciproducens galactitolivorans]|uniref:Mannitol-specific phosphotransferase enzyme IIA component n=1 Tax=Caproiciproducens galactitolivorans TaxID=642589 RepID=A0ABT4BWL9_9FIRM|nr:PTS sugar transporter subunit IIA [Caproiciproducens galactitolivorans]MCY1715293.1 PTS sugar transporter subunit IIA [Caproiciproducens galactitolivorans]
MFFKKSAKKSELLMKRNIVLNCSAADKEQAIRHAGELLVESGYVEKPYVDGMLARENKLSTCIGNSIAIPHGESEVKKKIICSGLVVMIYPDGIPWDSETVYLVVGIAAVGDEHLEILRNIVEKLDTPESVESLVRSGDANKIYNLFSGG